MIRRLIFLLVVLHVFTAADSYTQDRIPLSIGDRLPDLELKIIKNYAKKSLFIHELKGKAILLDFGTTSCGPCMKALKTLDSLQRLFNKDIQIFMVSPEKEETVASYLKNNRAASLLSIPIIAADSLLSKYFRYRSIPHQVWIDKDNRIKAFTDHHYLTRENLDSLIKGFTLNWPVKWDFGYDHQQPLMVLNTANLSPKSYPDAVLYQSYFSKNMSGIKPGITEVIDTSKNTVRISMINQSVVEMYLRLYGKIWNFVFPPSRVILNVKDDRRIFYDPGFGYKALWQKDNTYCYEAVFPLTATRESRNRKMLRELNDNLGLNVSLEKRKITCWVLKAQNGVKENNQGKTAGAQLLSVDQFIYSMNHTYQNPPVLDETTLPPASKSNMYIAVKPDTMKDYEVLNQQLAFYGFTLQKVNREIELLIFTDQQL